MRNKPLSTTVPLADDTEEMKLALKILNESGISFARPTRYQLKSGPHNFYPDKDTIFSDGRFERAKERGIDAFIKLVQSP